MSALDNYRVWAEGHLAAAEHQPDDRQPVLHRATGRWQIMSGGLVLVVAAVMWFTPGLAYTSSLSQAHALCSGPAGGFAQVLSSSARTACGHVSDDTTLVIVLALVGAGLVAWGLVRANRAGKGTA